MKNTHWSASFPETAWEPLNTDTQLPAISPIRATEPTHQVYDKAKTTDVRRWYAAAQEAHYRSKDLRQALETYYSVIASAPDSLEAGYSRNQVRNIAFRVVAPDALLEAHMRLARAELDDDCDAVGVKMIVLAEAAP